ncbi:MAG: hypothetical protein E4H03_01380 [Myxococcales bacterium]|nr:MAG: hypothetical protein E4H03_01380 [Myxococcales bacterium]
MPIISIEVLVEDTVGGETVIDTNWTNVSGLGPSLKECKPPKTAQKQRPANDDLVLSGPMCAGREYLATWFNAAFVSPKTSNPFRNLIVVLRNEDGTEARRWNIIDAFPTRWDPGEYSPSSNVATETIVCKMGRVELA